MAQNNKKSNPKKKYTKKVTPVRNRDKNDNEYFVKSTVLIIIGLLITMFLFLDPEAPVNGFFKELLLGLFGMPVFMLPFLIFEVGIYGLRKKCLTGKRLTFALLSLTCVSALYHLCTRGDLIPFGDSYILASGLYFSMVSRKKVE